MERAIEPQYHYSTALYSYSLYCFTTVFFLTTSTKAWLAVYIAFSLPSRKYISSLHLSNLSLSFFYSLSCFSVPYFYLYSFSKALSLSFSLISHFLFSLATPLLCLVYGSLFSQFVFSLFLKDELNRTSC